MAQLQLAHGGGVGHVPQAGVGAGVGYADVAACHRHREVHYQLRRAVGEAVAARIYHGRAVEDVFVAVGGSGAAYGECAGDVAFGQAAAEGDVALALEEVAYAVACGVGAVVGGCGRGQGSSEGVFDGRAGGAEFLGFFVEHDAVGEHGRAAGASVAEFGGHAVADVDVEHHGLGGREQAFAEDDTHADGRHGVDFAYVGMYMAGVLHGGVGSGRFERREGFGARVGVGKEIVAAGVVHVAAPESAAFGCEILRGVEVAQVEAHVGVAVEEQAAVGGVQRGRGGQVVGAGAEASEGQRGAAVAVHLHGFGVVESPRPQLFVADLLYAFGCHLHLHPPSFGEDRGGALGVCGHACGHYHKHRGQSAEFHKSILS